MRIGVVSGPHGGLVGLKAALDWLGKEGMDIVVCAEDLASFGPQPENAFPRQSMVGADSARWTDPGAVGWGRYSTRRPLNGE